MLLSVEDYLKRFASQLGRKSVDGHTSRPYFDSMTKVRSGDVVVGLLRFPKLKTEWVPGGPWPGNYAIYHITDFSQAKELKGLKKVKVKGGFNLVEWKGMNNEIPYPLKTTKQLLKEAVEHRRYYLYNLPHRFFYKYSKLLLTKVCGQVCQGSDLSKEQLAEVLRNMTVAERARYEQSLYQIDISLYPSVELPIKIRIVGIDDGAEEALFPTIQSAKDAMNNIAVMNMADRRRQNGFQGCD